MGFQDVQPQELVGRGQYPIVTEPPEEVTALQRIQDVGNRFSGF